MKMLLAAAFLCAVSSSAHAQTEAPQTSSVDVKVVPVAPTAEEITPIGTSTTKRNFVWKDVAFGMSREEVRALHPKGGSTDYNGDGSIEISDVSILGKCDAEVNIYFDESSVVDRVVINGDPSMGGRCSDQILAGLAGKYGQPLATDKKSGSILAREGKVYIWNRAEEGITMRFKKFSSGILGGGGMLKASWELTYTELARDISL